MAGKVGFIGLGAMGGPMALNLVKAGFKLVVHDIDQTKTAPLRAKGAELAGTAEAVAAEVERTIVIVETTDQAQAVIAGERGIIKGAKPGHIVLCMATIDPFAARTLADQLAALGTFNMLLADATHLYAYCNTHLHWLTRRAPFGEARSIDTGERVDFHELTTPNDIVTLVASRPLTDNEVWHAMTPHRLTVWRTGVAVASVAAGRLET